jgi:hypothetical protein
MNSIIQGRLNVNNAVTNMERNAVDEELCANDDNEFDEAMEVNEEVHRDENDIVIDGEEDSGDGPVESLFDQLLTCPRKDTYIQNLESRMITIHI